MRSLLDILTEGLTKAVVEKLKKKQPKYKKKGLVGPGGAWKTAKRQAKKQGQEDNDNYVGAIFKKMQGKK